MKDISARFNEKTGLVQISFDKELWIDVGSITKKDILIKRLKELQNNDDTERNHSLADDLLIEYIDDKEIKEEYDKVPKWYA